MWIVIDRKSKHTLSRQIYKQIRETILSGSIKVGYKLPSTRTLSAELGVSRNTIIEVYSQLAAEGYLNTREGSGTRVAASLIQLNTNTYSDKMGSEKKTSYSPTRQMIDFCTGIPALEQFPAKLWGDLYRQSCNMLSASKLSYTKSIGIYELRTAISQYLHRTRGVSCDPGQIIITSGATQGLSILSQVLQDSAKIVLVEDPSHAGLRKVITSAGNTIAEIAADEKGLCTFLLPDQKQISFIYTPPSHQYPLGSILPSGEG